jgi:hypothetical protein
MRVILFFAALLATLLATSDARYLRSTNSPVHAADEERVFLVRDPLTKAIAKVETAPAQSSKVKKIINKALKAMIPKARNNNGPLARNNGLWKFLYFN